MEERHPLGVLIDTVRRANGWSYDDLGRRAQEHGFKASKSWAHGLATRPVETVGVRQVKALAAALALPERQVLAAFLASMGYSPPGDRGSVSVEDAIAADGRLSAEDKELLLGMVKTMHARRPRFRDTRQRSADVPDAVTFGNAELTDGGELVVGEETAATRPRLESDSDDDATSARPGVQFGMEGDAVPNLTRPPNPELAEVDRSDPLEGHDYDQAAEQMAARREKRAPRKQQEKENGDDA